MKMPWFVTALALAILAATEAAAQIPGLPAGAQTHWIVAQPEEIVIYIAFNPAAFSHYLAKSFRFITVEELSTHGDTWATDYLTKHPAHGQWGVSFLEIVRMGTFTIDGRSPKWPKDGAAALWFARVASCDSSVDAGPGKPFQVLEFWLPDPAYVEYMRHKGYYATYGKVKLSRKGDGKWRGLIETKGLSVIAECIPTGPISGGVGSAGRQVLFQPASSGIKKLVRVAFAGHRIQECRSDSFWRLRGTHPLTTGTLLPPSNFEFGYDLVGGAYAMDSVYIK
jgi:hypothetical protein